MNAEIILAMPLLIVGVWVALKSLRNYRSRQRAAHDKKLAQHSVTVEVD